MITPRSASKFDLFAQAERNRKLEEVGDPLQVIAKHIDFNKLAALVQPFLGRGDGRKGGRPAYPVDVMVRVLVLKQLYNLSDEQMEYQLLDRMSYQRFCLLEHSLKRLASFLHQGVNAFYKAKPSKMQLRLKTENA